MLVKNKTKTIFFRSDGYSFNSEQFTTRPGQLRTFQILIVLLYDMVLNFACLNFAQSFFCAY